jgi:hypothetical protein
MQAVEDLRHRAEQLELKAASLPGERGRVLLRIAARMRELAAEEADRALAGETLTAKA